MELKSFDLEMKADDADEGTFKGYLSTFGNVDRVNDIILPGAFKSAKAKKTLLLWQHDTHEVIGGFKELREDEKGLYVEAELNMDVQRGREAHALLKKGHINSMSIGYIVEEKNQDFRADGVREIKKVELFEGSLVSIPANPKALVRGVKSDDLKTIRAFEAELSGDFSRKEIAKIMSCAKNYIAFDKPDERDAVGDDGLRDAPILTEEMKSQLVELRDAFKGFETLISQ